MKIVDQISNLEIYTNKMTSNPKSLNRRQRQKVFRFLCEWYSQIFLDLFQEKGGIDYNSDPLFFRMTQIADKFYKLMR